MIEVTGITDDIAEEVARFFRAVWSKDATADSVRRARAESARLNPAFPGVAAPAIVYLRDGEVIGHLGTVPVTFWNGVTELPAYWLRGFMVLPEHRNGPVGFAVLKEMLKHLDVSGIMTVAAPARRLFKAVGYANCGVIPNYISVLRAARVARSIDIAALGLGLPAWLDRAVRASQKIGLASIGGAVVGVGLMGVRTVRATPGFASTRSATLPPAAELDELWTRARPGIAAGAVRNGAFLTWRYDCRPAGPYEAAVVRERASGRLAAVAIVRRPSDTGDQRLRGIKVATLADLLFQPDDRAAGMAAVAAAERTARRMGADAILCSAAHPAITTALRRRAFVRLPGNVHLMLRDPKKAAALPLELESWWVTRGDAHSDEVF